MTRCFAFALLACHAAGSVPYPVSRRSITTLFAVEEDGRSKEELLCLDSVAGNLARQSPQLYRVGKANWADQAVSDGYSDWLLDMQKKRGINVDSSLIGLSFQKVVQHFVSSNRGSISSYVRCNPGDASVSAAITYAAAGDGVLIAASQTVADALESAGVSQVKDLRGKAVRDVLADVLPRLSTRIFVFQDTSKMANLGDYAIFARAPSIAFGKDQAAQSALLARAQGPAAAFGWGPENDFVSTLNRHGVYVHASDWSKNLAALSNAPPAVHSIPTATAEAPRVQSTEALHTVAFLMSDGDNLQWTLGNWEVDKKYWGSPQRGKIPMGWTFSPSSAWVAPSALAKVLTSKSPNDELVAGPSGVGYMFPQTWPQSFRSDFSALTFQGMKSAGMRLVNVLGQNDNMPDMDSLSPLLASSDVDGMIYYGWGDGYASLKGKAFWVDSKPVITGRLSLWGEATSGLMLGVQPMVEALKKQAKDVSSAAGYSLVIVHAWSHNYTDAVTIAEALAAEGGFDVVLPSELVRRFKANVKPPSSHITCQCTHVGEGAPNNGYECTDPSKNAYCASTQFCMADGDWNFPVDGQWSQICQKTSISSAILL
eukprot:CAMPEP_0172673566 /NCGR_PEP_ID=MMETSP1074-20121228/12220_1 /TAXON_ID=2916 /ORGANISM="Ceratium fusus, Strain PA161109" /LENGTH=597 /DNA_ID=CAMNT_0013490881 /DNA_START=69 /DNA_END=1862 /DNA_ORIENTATION=+